MTIGRHGVLTPEQARDRARELLGAVASGEDPAQARAVAKSRPTVESLFLDFMSLHVEPKLKGNTALAYRSMLTRYVLPEWGSRTAEDLAKVDVMKLHAKLQGNKFVANRVLNHLSAMFSWAAGHAFVPEHCNPTIGSNATRS